MNEELMKHLVPIIEKTKEGIFKAIDIAKEQFPELVRQIIAWEFSVGVMCLILGLILLGLGCWGVHLENKYGERWKSEGCIGGISCFIVLASFGLIAPGVMKMVKIIVASKLFLLEYISKLIK